MAEPQNRLAQAMDRVLEQSLPKPGVAEAMRFWHYSRPLPANRCCDAEVVADISPRIATLMSIRDKLVTGLRGQQ